MFSKNKSAILIFIVSAVIVLGSFLVARISECAYIDTGFDSFVCGGSFEKYIEPIFWAFLPLLAISLILLFLRREVFMAWVKFAAVAFPIMLAILLYTYNNKPTPGAGGFGLAGLISDEMLATAFLPALFFIVSLIVIITKRLKEARARKQSL